MFTLEGQALQILCNTIKAILSAKVVDSEGFTKCEALAGKFRAEVLACDWKYRPARQIL